MRMEVFFLEGVNDVVLVVEAGTVNNVVVLCRV